MNTNYKNYKAYPTMQLENREWPTKSITKAPIWCSVDLRDGNQALPEPMSVEQKIEMFTLLKEMGYKEIEIGFPSASDTEFRFLRRLIEEGHVPSDVKVQVLVQAREHLIARTFESLKGSKEAIVHFYNSTSTQQREVVFGKTKDEIKEIAIEGAKLLLKYEAQYPETTFYYEYSPESFTGTEMDYAMAVCNAVIDVLKPTPDKKLIINIPATVEMATPNVYADQVEWFSKTINKRDSIILSLHAHNDRGTAVAATELSMMAGADRVEGTLFGNGERTGNVDILNVAMNLFSQGIDPEVNIENVNHIIDVYTHTTGMSVHDRHPYAGKLVYTAFSGSHQDAIRKGLKHHEDTKAEYWNVPYLPINPDDIGRQYEPIIRINSQSGKGGVAYILEDSYGYTCPKPMHPELSAPIQKKTDETGKELTPDGIFELFIQNFVNIETPMKLVHFNSSYKDGDENSVTIESVVRVNGTERKIVGLGNGPISAFFHGIQSIGYDGYKLKDYTEHAISGSEDAVAAAYIQLENEAGKKCYGVGTDANINKASIKALISAINRLN
ncbi:MAG: 2-isopropylmalate synthase [Vallitaleaceae bacterium]|jgi:2-isopropylmalate synthase|nr:2-isopropylmalate synthase [Vallitaleaceae bacterium]